MFCFVICIIIFTNFGQLWNSLHSYSIKAINTWLKCKYIICKFVNLLHIDGFVQKKLGQDKKGYF